MQHDVLVALKRLVTATPNAGQVRVAMKFAGALQPVRLTRTHTCQALTGLIAHLVIEKPEPLRGQFDGVVGVYRLALPLKAAGVLFLLSPKLPGAPAKFVVAALGALQIRWLHTGQIRLRQDIPGIEPVAHDDNIRRLTQVQTGDAPAYAAGLPLRGFLRPEKYMRPKCRRLDRLDGGMHPRMPVGLGQSPSPVKIGLVGVVPLPRKQFRQDEQVALSGR